MASSLSRFASLLFLGISLPVCAKAQWWNAPPPAQAYPVGRSTTQAVAPYCYVGRILVTFGPDDYIGSGTVIKPHGALTAGHMLWDGTYGWGTNISLERGYFYGSRLTLLRPTHKYILAGYSQQVYANGVDSDQAFNRDMGALTFSGLAAKGASASYLANPHLLNGYTFTMSLGYGAEIHDGEQLLTVSPNSIHSNYRAPYYQVFSGASYYFNDGYLIEGGMSGGPIVAIFNNKWYVVGINVSGNDYGMGMRAVDSTATSFIATYLK